MLKLNSLHLEHFMCITEADLNFNANCIIIEGDNGQGKSAVMEAVAICLSERKRSDSVKEFIQKPHDHAKIILDLTYNGEQVLFDVNLNHKGGTPLERDVTYQGVHYINSEVTDLIKRLDFTFYSDIIMSMQGADDITTMTPTMRLNLLQRLFQFDFTDEIGPIEEKLEDFSKNRIVNNDRIDFLERANKQKEQNLNNLKEKEFAFSKEEYDNYKKLLEEKNNELEDFNEAIDKTYEVLEKKTELLNQIKALQDKKINLNKKLADNDKIIEELETADYENKIKSLEEKAAACTDTINNLNVDISKKKTEIDELQKIYSDLNVSLGELKATRKSLSKKKELIANGVCPECGKPTKDLDIDKVEKDDKDNEAKIAAVENNINETHKNILTLKSEVEELRKQVATANASYSDFKAAATAEHTKAVTAKLHMMSAEEVETSKKDIEQAEEQIKPLESQVAIYDTALSERNQKTLERTNLKKEIADITDKIRSSDEIADHNKVVELQRTTIKNEILENEKNVETFKKTIAEIDLDVQTYNEVLRVLDKELPNYLVVKTCARLETEMNNFVNIVFPEFRLRLLQSKRGVEFFYTTDPKVDMNDIKKLINSKMASGYERSVLGLSFKVALCKAYNLSFIALDEIDAAASEGNSVLTMESLIGSSTFSQIFFITHKEATRDVIKSLCDSVICYHTEKGVFTNEESD